MLCLPIACQKSKQTSKMHCSDAVPRMADGHAKTWRAGGGVPPKGKAIRRHPKGRSVTESKSNKSFEFFELKESSQAPRIPHPPS